MKTIRIKIEVPGVDPDRIAQAVAACGLGEAIVDTALREGLQGIAHDGGKVQVVAPGEVVNVDIEVSS